MTRAFVPEGGLVVSPTPELPAVPHPGRDPGSPLPDRALHRRLELARPLACRPGQLDLPRQSEFSLRDRPSNCLRLERLAEQLAGPLVVDEAYVDFAERHAPGAGEPRECRRDALAEQVVCLAGIRFGFAVADPPWFAS